MAPMQWIKRNTNPSALRRFVRRNAMLELTASPIAIESNIDALDASNTDPHIGQENSDEQIEFEIFAPADLKALSEAGYETIIDVANRLISMVQKEPEYPTHTPLYGRFALCSFAESAIVHRLAFRLARQALEFLEADYLACEQTDLDFWRLQVDTIEAMRNGEKPDSSTLRS